MICKNCIHEKVCKHKTKSVYECEHFKDGTIKNQYDRIRNMSVEEMAEFIDYSIWEDENYHTVIDKKVLFNLEEVKQYLESEVTE